MDTQSTRLLQRWLTLYLIPKIGVKTLEKLLDVHHISIDELLAADPARLAQFKLGPRQIEAIVRPDQRQIDALLAWAEPANRHIVCYFDASLNGDPDNYTDNYPDSLKNIACPPLLLFVKGDPRVLGEPQLAMVGSRNLTVGGQDNAWLFARQLSELGIVITSGLAIGVDGHCHRGALSANGKTLAVLGSGLEQIYPKQHFSLAEQIIADGALVSEFLPQQGPRAEHFPRRNRIISGLSQGILVIEAALKSGSLISAKYAMEQGREVFAVPGSIHNPMSRGCHALIKQGAKLVEGIDDIIEEIPLFGRLRQIQADQPALPPLPDQPVTPPHSPLLLQIGYEMTPVDIIAQRCALPVNEVLCQLFDLEMQGDIAAVAGGYMRIRQHKC